MEFDLNTIILAAGSLAGGVVIGLFVLKPMAALTWSEYEHKAREQVQKSGHEAEKVKNEVMGRIQSLRERNVQDEEMQKEQFKRIENLILSKEEQLQKKEQKLNEIKKLVDEENAFVDQLRQKNREIEKEFTVKLSAKTGQSLEEVKAQILHELERDLELEREDRLRKQEEYLNEDKVRIAKNMITGAIQRYSSPTSVEKKSTTLTVERDEIKGRVIGKAAENLKLIEELTGVDIIFNDDPNTIIVSCFDLVRKHIAREAILKLTRERIVTPEIIKQKLEEAKADMEKVLIKIGQDVIKKLELDDRKFPPDFAKIVGRLEFRTSYGQNILKHSYEVGHFTLMLASELGLNMETSKVAGFFHDLGKAIDQEVGMPHDQLTKEIMEKYTFSEDEIHAAWAHHDAVPQRTAEAMLVKAGDAISAGRPGARQETLEKYIERITAIEKISSSYEGVSKAFAISAGREVRVIVEPAKLNDGDLADLAKNIAKEIQDSVAYPGRIKVNVIRRTQSIDYTNRIPGPTKKLSKNK